LIYLFDDYSLDTDRRELRRGLNLIALEPQVFDLLQHLVLNRDRVVSAADLAATVWRGRTVSASTVGSRIAAVVALLAIGVTNNGSFSRSHAKAIDSWVTCRNSVNGAPRSWRHNPVSLNQGRIRHARK
jgi:hypothetical protein